MCLNCLYGQLDQLRWELVLQQHELNGTKISSEVAETAKERFTANGIIMPKISLLRPKDMSDQEYQEASQIFKEVMLQKRQQQIAAIEILTDLLENEIFQPRPLSIDARAVLNGGEESQET
jgi:hypothetical protein